jgi:hypothetical protein
VVGEPRQGAAPPPSPDPAAGAQVEEEPQKKRKKKKKKQLPRPDGPCADSDVLVAPVVEEAHVNEPIAITLEVSAAESEACTWEVAPDSVFVTITAPERPIWSSQHCPAAIPTEEVVARRVKPAEVTLRWNGKESDPACSAVTDWVLTGSYTVTAIARGSVVPSETDFVLQGARPAPRKPERKKPDTAEPREEKSRENERDGQT